MVLRSVSYIVESAINSICVAWRRHNVIWLVNPRTCSEIVQSNSAEANIQKQFFIFIYTCKYLIGNNLAAMMSKLAISNPMSITGCNYRDM